MTTGAPIPDNFHTVVPIEHVVKSNKKALIKLVEKAKCGNFIREIGSDIQKDELVLKKDTEINAA